jgi:hypothetical protein
VSRSARLRLTALLERGTRAGRVEADGRLAVHAVAVEVHGGIGTGLGDDRSQSAQETSCHGVDP